MALLISLFLALLPLLGVLYIVIFGSLTTVDGLFMSLILLSISGILGLNVLIELRKGKSAFAPSHSVLGARSTGPISDGSRLKTRGKVKDVVFFESNVGQPNKSIVTLSDGAFIPNPRPRGRRAQRPSRRPDARDHVAERSRKERAGRRKLRLTLSPRKITR